MSGGRGCLQVDEAPDPSTSVLVLNLGAVRGKKCPDDHWPYHPVTRSGFYRTGSYSNVAARSLPASRREAGDRVSLYIERAFATDSRLSEDEVAMYCRRTIEELRSWRFIEDVEVLDPTWIDTAYTWRRPGSRWRESAIAALRARNIFMLGRYGRWQFQGIAESLREGLCAGAAFGAKRQA